MTQIQVHKDQYQEWDDVNHEERVRKYLPGILLEAPKPIDICRGGEGMRPSGAINSERLWPQVIKTLALGKQKYFIVSSL